MHYKVSSEWKHISKHNVSKIICNKSTHGLSPKKTNLTQLSLCVQMGTFLPFFMLPLCSSQRSCIKEADFLILEYSITKNHFNMARTSRALKQS